MLSLELPVVFGTRLGLAVVALLCLLPVPRADLWLHGHLHCRHDYHVDRPGRAPTRVLCKPLGLQKKGEQDGYVRGEVIEI